MNKDDRPKYVPLEERWKHDIPYFRVTGHVKLTEEEKKAAAERLQHFIELAEQGKPINDDDDLKD